MTIRSNGAGVYPLGNVARHANTVSSHISADATIRAHFNTPSSIDLGADMSVGEIEYASFIASDQVRLNPGFKVQHGLLRISVGSQVMAKRGVPEDSYAFHDDEKKNVYPAFVQKFQVRQMDAGKTIRVAYQGEMNAKPEVYIYDAMGVMVRHIKEIQTTDTDHGFISALSLKELGSGGYFLRLQLGKNNLYRKFNL